MRSLLQVKILCLFLIVALAVFLIIACQKEYSCENCIPHYSHGALQDSVGQCLGIIVAGVFIKNTQVDTSNYIYVRVKVDSAGVYNISTDTVNGFYFSGTGVFSNSGITTVRLSCHGTPVNIGVDIFTAKYDTSECKFVVTTTSGTKAVFTLNGSPDKCDTVSIEGNYTLNTPMTTANKVTIRVNVSTPGVYNIVTTEENGVVFTASGVFTTTGVQNVVLQANGIVPLGGAGYRIFWIMREGTYCNFEIFFANAPLAEFSLNGFPGACSGTSMSGLLIAGVPANASNTITVSVNVTRVGEWLTIATNTVNGIQFGITSGIFTKTGVQLVTLKCSGTPVSAGTFNLVAYGGGTTCTFSVTVAPNNSSAIYTLNGAPSFCSNTTIGGVYLVDIPMNATNTATMQVNVITPGNYSITTDIQNTISFSASGTFTTTGLQLVTLVGTGYPAIRGNFTFTVLAPTSSCTFTVAMDDEFFPRTPGDNWSYIFNDKPTDTLLRKVIAPVLTISGNSYNIFLQTKNAANGFDSSGYYNKIFAGDYFCYADIGKTFSLDNPLWAEYIFFKDYLITGSWASNSFSGTRNGTPITVRIKESIQQWQTIVTVNGLNYRRTTIVREDYEYLNGGNWLPALPNEIYAIAYYSRNVGLIKKEYFDYAGSRISSQKIKRYIVL